MKFTIYRKSWRRGGADVEEIDGVEQRGITELLNAENMFCCLGMCAIQHGVKPMDIVGVGEPHSLGSDQVPCKTVLWGEDDELLVNSKLSEAAIPVNDAEDITEAERERKLKAIFRKRGHKLEFVNRLAPKSWRVAGKE